MEIPAPNSTDPEDVVTALETAAIFAGRKDVAESARWLGRAADLANLNGNTARAETLAQAARTLSQGGGNVKDGLESPPPLPTAPPRRASIRPAAPSERAHDRDSVQPMLLTRPAAAPGAAVALESNPSRTPAPSAVTTPLHGKDKHEESAVRESAPKPTEAPTSTPKPTDVRESSPKPTEAPKSAPKPANVSQSPAKPSETPKPALKPSLHHELHRPFRLQGARVSLAPSQASSRYYVVKVLDDDERVPEGEHEAFLVLTDPRAAR